MLNVRRRTRITVCIWMVIAVLACLVLSSQAKAEEKMKDKTVAVVVLWYTVDGKPHNIFVVDYNHIRVLDTVVVIDRTPNVEPADQVIRGGMLDMQSFGYYQLFDHKTGRLKDNHQAFADRFKQKANEHLKLEKPKMNSLQ